MTDKQADVSSLASKSSRRGLDSSRRGLDSSDEGDSQVPIPFRSRERSRRNLRKSRKLSSRHMLDPPPTRSPIRGPRRYYSSHSESEYSEEDIKMRDTDNKKNATGDSQPPRPYRRRAKSESPGEEEIVKQEKPKTEKGNRNASDEERQTKKKGPRSRRSMRSYSNDFDDEGDAPASRPNRRNNTSNDHIIASMVKDEEKRKMKLFRKKSEKISRQKSEKGNREKPEGGYSVSRTSSGESLSDWVHLLGPKSESSKTSKIRNISTRKHNDMSESGTSKKFQGKHGKSVLSDDQPKSVKSNGTISTLSSHSVEQCSQTTSVARRQEQEEEQSQSDDSSVISRSLRNQLNPPSFREQQPILSRPGAFRYNGINAQNSSSTLDVSANGGNDPLLGNITTDDNNNSGDNNTRSASSDAINPSPSPRPPPDSNDAEQNSSPSPGLPPNNGDGFLIEATLVTEGRVIAVEISQRQLNAGDTGDSTGMIAVEGTKVDSAYEKNIDAESVGGKGWHCNGREWKPQQIVMATILGIFTLFVIAIAIGVSVSAANERRAGNNPQGTPPPLSGLDFYTEVLPDYSRERIENDPTSSQALAYGWLMNDPLINQYSNQRKLQRFVLSTFYYAMNGRYWDRSDNWLEYNQDIHECDWYSADVGVQICDDNTYEILNLAENNLIGTIPRELGLLYTLQIINFRNNRIMGTIPPTLLEQLTTLSTIEVGSNSLVGSIPSEIGLLSSLGYLSLEFNNLNGTLPTEIGNLLELTEFFVNRNELSGTIPTEIGSLSQVESFLASDNVLTGSIPTEIGQASAFIILDLEINLLQNMIPSEIGLLDKMEYLYLSSNQLTGTIPSTISLMDSLQESRLRDNSLIGPLPIPVCQKLLLSDIYFQVDCAPIGCQNCGCFCW